MALTPHTPTDRPTECLDAVLLASYVDGRTSPDERASVEAHLARCEDCYFVFAETVRDRQARAKKSRWRYWVPRAAAGLATAAALVEREAWLGGSGDVPTSWPGLDVLAPALPRKGRHGAILLPFLRLDLRCPAERAQLQHAHVARREPEPFGDARRVEPFT